MSDFSVKIEAYIREKQEGKGRDFCAATWLDWASKIASKVSFATHVLKYTHGDAEGTNVCLKLGSSQDDYATPYISTDSLFNVRKDIVVGNAANMGIAGLLLLEVDGITFLDLITKDDTSLLAPFAKSEDQLLSWMNSFKSILIADRKLSSHTLAKQIYFPIEAGKYHLLAPLYASSLSQALYDRVKDDRFGGKAKEARECKKKGEYSDTVIANHPDLAIQKFGGAKPQNISYLNSRRKGDAYLLRSAPPHWKSIKKPPMKKNAFWKRYERIAENDLKEFKHFLIVVRNSDSNKDIRNRINDYIDQLLDRLLLAAAEVQSMAPGWSKASEVSLHEQLWLDPHREDFAEMRCKEAWKETVSSRFATWVIQKIEDDSLKFIDMNHRFISDKCFEALKRFEP